MVQTTAWMRKAQGGRETGTGVSQAKCKGNIKSGSMNLLII